MARKVKQSKKPSVPKKAVPGDKPDPNNPDGHPSWRFESFDPDFPPGGGLEALDPSAFDDIVTTLKSCEQDPCRAMYNKWQGVKGGAVRYGPDTLERLPKETKDRLDQLQLGEIESLVRINAGGNLKRLFAWRGDADVFNIVWWDPNHEVYPTEPKNT